MVTFYIITLFPEAFDSYLKSSIIGRAIREKKIAVKFYNPRDFVSAPHSLIGANGRIRKKQKNKWFYRQVDDKPYGGGPGMVLQALPYMRAAQKAIGKKKAEVYFFDTSGKQFSNADARALARNVGFRKPYIRDVVLICGHYEGVDARVQKVLKAKKISVGPYTLTGGELPAMLVIDAVSRQVKGVLGTFESIEEERVSSSEVYTRPEILVWKGKKHRVPKVLLSGNHAKIDSWKRKR